MTSWRVSKYVRVAGALVLCGTIGAGALRSAAPASGLPVPPAAARPMAAAAADHRAGNPLWAVPLSSLRATHERPLFSSSRRPPAPPIVAAVAPPAPLPKPPPPAPQQPSLVLVGTVSGPSGGMAVFTDPATNAVVRLRMREGHGGWILSAVSERAATLQKDGETTVLALPRRDSAAAAPVADAATAPPPRIPLPVLRRP
jgi:hypothetical protein